MKLRLLYFTSLIFILTMVVACKPKAVVPTFNIKVTEVTLTSGGTGLQFKASCTNTEIKMDKVVFTSPDNTPGLEYSFNGRTCLKDEFFPLQTIVDAYTKETGIWKMRFSGIHMGDAAPFTVDGSIQVYQ